jgi:hypothetical protein
LSYENFFITSDTAGVIVVEIVTLVWLETTVPVLRGRFHYHKATFESFIFLYEIPGNLETDT